MDHGRNQLKSGDSDKIKSDSPERGGLDAAGEQSGKACRA